MKDVITAAIKEILKELGLPDANFVVDHPADLSHGDYACNVALVLSKQVGQPPRAIAEQLLAALSDQIEYVDRLEIAGPGFINFYLSRDFFAAEIERINSLGLDWGSNSKGMGENVMIEYTSPNLFKPLHVGNLVGNIIGESLSRIAEFSSATVKRFNYPSDIGLTVAKGVWGLRKLGADGSDIAVLGEAYRIGNEAYEAEGEEKAQIITVNQALYAGSDESLNQLRAVGISTSKARLKELLTLLDTHFDVEIYESEVSDPGLDLVRKNTGTVFSESAGAVVFAGEKVGLHTRVFINSLGLPTYEAKDLGNYVLKQKQFPEWTRSIVVTGNEQTEYFKVLFAALRELFADTANKTLEHIPTGFLTLTTGKMSSRKGNVLTGESLLEEMREAAAERAATSRTDNLEELTKEVAVAALKYQILRQHIGANIVFDKEKSLSFDGDSGPYLQYTHARIVSVLDKAAAIGLSSRVAVTPETPYAIERLVYQFEEVILQAFIERAPHKITGYLIELAATFNAFYAQEKIADESDVFAPYKLALAEAVAITLKNGLWALGIKAPEKM